MFKNDSHRESLRKAHPVERLLDLGQSLHTSSVGLIKSPSNALYAAAKSFVGVAQEINASLHPRADVTEEVFAEIGDYIPGTIIDQAQYFAPFVRILANGDIQISDISVKRGAHITVLEIEFCVV